MGSAEARVVLVSSNRDWLTSCETALREKGVDSIEAHNCWSADVARELHGGEAVVIDGHSLCDFVSVDRPGPVLVFSPEVPVVVFNAESLDEQHRAAATAHKASMVDGEDIVEIARCVEGVLAPS